MTPQDAKPSPEPPPQLNDSERERQMLADAHEKGVLSTLGVWTRLSGPGWLQSAITLGGGSLASSLYLGILAGFTMMWLQPLAMILGIIMLSAIGYVTMSTGERPFKAINEHVNPVLGWGWALAAAAANVVWCLPQYSLADGVISHNLLPQVFGETGAIASMTASMGASPWIAANAGTFIVSLSLLIICTMITWSYDRPGWGLKLYEVMLKTMVGLIVLCFFGVVLVLSWSEKGLPWGQILQGFVPDFTQLFRPATSLRPILDRIAEVNPEAAVHWAAVIVDKQRDVMIAAAATAVGINMTFLFPYSLLRKGWTKEFRGLAMFDLGTGMLIPFVLATSCVVIASAAQFHTKVTEDFLINEATGEVVVPDRFQGDYDGWLKRRTDNTEISGELTLEERKMAAMLVDRKANDLSGALETLLQGKLVADYIFGLGVLAMTLSTISILMLISGFVICEMLGYPPTGWPHRLGALVAGVGGFFGPFIWGKASFYLAVPTSVFGFVLLPFAYITFVLLMNQKSLLGPEAPQGGKRLVWNLLMGIAATVASVGSVYMIWNKAGWYGIGAVIAFITLAVIVQIIRPPNPIHQPPTKD